MSAAPRSTPAKQWRRRLTLPIASGAWIGFHNCDQPTFFAMVEGYAAEFKLPIESDARAARAVEWSVTRWRPLPAASSSIRAGPWQASSA